METEDDVSTSSTGHSVVSSVIREGKAEILVKSGDRVFYNPVQEFNRDLSVAVLTVFAREHRETKKYRKGVKRAANGGSKEDEGIKKISVLDALSATGLRAIRFALEVPGLDEIVANDLSKTAVESIKANVEHNKVHNLVATSLNDASLAMHLFKSERRLFDAVDLDPYGCPSRFLDSAVQVLEDGGLAMITATDMAVLAGNTPSTCYAKYGAVSLRNSACHEMALRIVLQCIQAHANRYGRYVVPLLSMSADFYVRLFVRIYTSPSMCKRTTSQLSLVGQCVGCKTLNLLPMGEMTSRNGKDPLFTLPRLPELSNCPHCQFSYQLGGPIWTGPLHDREFVQKVISHVETTEFNTKKRIIGMLSLIKNEIDVPLYYTVSSLCSSVHCTMIPLLEFRSALLNAGYDVSESHAAPDSVKTTAPARVVWDVIRAWVVNGHPVAEKRLESSEVARKILGVGEPETRVDFSRHPRAPVPTRGLLRYQVNPTAHWGPGMRSTNNLDDAGASKDAKRKLKQNKTKLKAEKETEGKA